MTKHQWREIELAWKQFDRSTAHGCAQRRIAFNLKVCEDAWYAYNALLAAQGIPRPPTPIGLQ